jgi:hypothetical protein
VVTVPQRRWEPGPPTGPLEGPYGTAELVPRSRYAALSPAVLAKWIISVPGWSPYWWQYALAVITLADLPGVPPVPAGARRRKANTHELVVVALHPDHGPYTAAATPEPLPVLLPFCIAEQFEADDAAAVHIAEDAARAVCAGVLAPEKGDEPQRVIDTWRQWIDDHRPQLADLPGR